MVLRPHHALYLLTFLLLSCSGGKDDAGDVAAPSPEVESTAAGAASTAGATSTPDTVLTPKANAPRDLSQAKRLESEGDTRGAAEAYIAAAANGGSSKGEATLGAARMLLELEKPEDVRTLLEPFVGTASGQDVASRYLLARAYAALEMWTQSLEQYDRYISSGRAALPYAHLNRSQVLMELQRPLEAAAAAQTGLDMGVPGGSRRAFRLAIAQAYERAGSFDEAIRRYREITDDAFSLSRIVAIKRAQSDSTYVEDLKVLMAEYPSSSQAMEALEEAVTKGEPIDPVVKGLIYYRHNEYTKAQTPFEEQIRSSPNAMASATAYYYMGAIQESKGEPELALDNYELTVQTNPASSLADDALWWQARILEADDETVEARELYARIVTQYPRSEWASDAAFRHGMLVHGAGKHREASELWGGSALTAPLAEQERLTFWQAKALIEANDKNAAKPILEQLAKEGQDDYYGIRAHELLNDRHEQPEATQESNVNLTPSFDWTTAEGWLAQKTGRTITNSGWSTDSRWIRAQELWLVGRNSQGDSEAFDLIESNASDPIAMYTMARTLLDQGRIGMSGRAGQRLMRTLDTNPNEGLPKALLSLSYPAAFGPLAKKYSDDAKISPLLLLAFVRQESFFDPRAISPVGALGLTQLLPGTGRSVASGLKLSEPDNEGLLNADLNLRLGARYMADQLDTFNDEIFVALAAYNAGPNGANRWRKESGNDADLFLEAVEFKETRLYIELVSENYAIYRYLYGGSDTPDMPD